jgi:biopolymer transport protein ExbD
VPGLNLAALPDLIFTVLFFFMIVTHMRVVTPLVHVETPQGTELEKARKQGVIYLFIGQPMDAKGQVEGASDSRRIQLNDRFAEPEQVETFIRAERAGLSSEDRKQMTISIKADKHTDMGTVTAVKQQLRKAGALRINYSAKSR